MRYTKTTLQHLETIMEEIGYTVRYEKGSFNSGYCLVEQKKIAVINKFFDTEGRINSLNDIMGSIEIDESMLSDAMQKFLHRWRKRTASQEDAGENEDALPS
jgi:hypothetical protein